MPRFNHSLLLYNGNAGGSTAASVLSLCVPALSEASTRLELVRTESEEDFLNACRDAADADALFVAGGDGTVHLAVQALTAMDKPPLLGILPSGTCNDFARTLGIPLSLDEAAEALASGNAEEIDTARINGRSFLNFAGIGLITEASLNIEPEAKERYGKLSYFRSGLQSLRQAEPFSATLTVDGFTYEEEGVLVLVMNGKSIGTHTFPLDSLDPGDGLLDIFIIQSASLAAVREWFSLSQPDALEDELQHIRHLQGRHIIIQTRDKMDVDTDGEIYLTTPLEIDIEPKRLKMLVPQKDQLSE